MENEAFIWTIIFTAGGAWYLIKRHDKSIEKLDGKIDDIYKELHRDIDRLRMETNTLAPQGAVDKVEEGYKREIDSLKEIVLSNHKSTSLQIQQLQKELSEFMNRLERDMGRFEAGIQRMEELERVMYAKKK